MPESITLDIDLNITTGKLEQLKNDLYQIRTAAESIPDFGETLGQNLENALSTVSLLSNKI